MRVEVKPELLRWARERSGGALRLAGRSPLPAWERGEAQPTLKQVESFAKATYTPVGYLFLQEPPVERVPIPDFRTVANAPTARAGPARHHLHLPAAPGVVSRLRAVRGRGAALPFVGSVTVDGRRRRRPRRASGTRSASTSRSAAGLPTWTDALRRFIEQADALGVLVMVSGVVGSNNRRKLDPEEFRGFALADDLAPLVFINGADTKAAQMFTLAHELAHIWLGQSARLRRAGGARSPTHAGRALVQPGRRRVAGAAGSVSRRVSTGCGSLRAEVDRLARRFKVSTLVILRRIHDAGGLTGTQFWAGVRGGARTAARDSEGQRRRLLPDAGGAGQQALRPRAGRQHAGRADVCTEMPSACSVSRRLATFRELGHSLGVVA